MVGEDFYQLTLGQLLRPLVELDRYLGAHADDCEELKTERETKTNECGGYDRECIMVEEELSQN